MKGLLVQVFCFSGKCEELRRSVETKECCGELTTRSRCRYPSPSLAPLIEAARTHVQDDAALGTVHVW